MRGTVYGGMIYFPQHPCADMHGMVRACIRSRNWLTVRHAWKAYGIDFEINPNLHLKLWQESKSVVERNATEGRYGEILVCSLVEAYLRVDRYAKIPRELLQSSKTPFSGQTGMLA